MRGMRKLSCGMKIVLCYFLIVLVLLNFSNAKSSPRSTEPVIEVPNGRVYIGTPLGQEFTLTFIIIDDDPWNFTLSRARIGTYPENYSKYIITQEILDFGTLESDVLHFTRTEPEGEYIFILVIYDLSGNFASKEVGVLVGPEGGEDGAEDAASGFEFLPLSIGIIVLYCLKQTQKVGKIKSEE